MSMFISCDWGTSAFRLRLLEGSDVLATLSTGEGIAATHAAWQASGLPPIERVAYYRAVLEKAIGGLASGAHANGETQGAGGQHPEGTSGDRGLDLHGVPVVISGMASSSIGMLELPYHPLPFDASGADLRSTTLPPAAGSPRTLYLLSGVRSADDVMRGEETQLIGCGAANVPGERVFVFPGTHSKHILVRNGRAIDLKTYMTGELFTLLARQSILAGAVSAPDAIGVVVAATDVVAPGPASSHLAGAAGPALPRAAGLPAAFYAGVSAARESGLLHNAFLTRTNHLFNQYSKEDNYHFLSGLLIGEELMELLGHPRENGAAFPSRQFRPITLVASSPLREAYAAALARLGVGQPTVIDADQALIAGHCAIIARFGATIAL
ncbi:MAG TPA: 2-dehydro-3-deoxygalactonokinase [Puia sp.]|nr:2-dehydro-3-deoxygalactonokinase [Puia sp.]